MWGFEFYFLALVFVLLASIVRIDFYSQQNATQEKQILNELIWCETYIALVRVLKHNKMIFKTFYVNKIPSLK